MRNCVVSVFVLVCVCVCVNAQTDCGGSTNTLPIYKDTPTLLRSIKNAKLYSMDHGDGKTIRVLHLYGTPYEMGFAQARILSDEIPIMFKNFFKYIDDQIAPYISKLPKDIQKIIEEDGVPAALQFTYDLTKDYTPQRFFDEMQGLSDGLNNTIEYKTIVQVHMFPELIKASCSIIGAWGEAVANTSDVVNQLRALDWGIDNPLVNHPIVVVYHPNEGNGHPFASLTWTGFIGSVTSYSPHVGVSEKVWLSYNETASRAGIPFHFLIRDMAQFDVNIDAALNRIYNSKRTCSIHLGLGSISDKQARVVEYSHEEVFVYDDKNYPAYPPYHPLFDGLVFVNKHVQPSKHMCMGSLMSKYYGSINAENTIRQVLGYTQSGDVHAAFYEYGNNNMYVSVAGPTIDPNTLQPQKNTTSPAHARPWFKLDMDVQFAVKQDD
eukprot:m.239995 g.239995  ORF g.239995 m.239995 type:complete len:436 (+) comp14353_c0_seq1:60-1367(+)